MEVILRTGFQPITHSLDLKPQSEKRGKKLIEAERVLQVEELRRNGVGYLIRDKVVKQMKVNDEQYDVILHLDAKRSVIRVTCTCVYNQSECCKHVLALIQYVNSDQSSTKTSEEQGWGKPSIKEMMKQKYSKGKNFDEMRPPKKMCRASSPIVCNLLDSSILNQNLPSHLPNPSHLQIVVTQMQKDPAKLAEEVALIRSRRQAQKREAIRVLQNKCRAVITTLPIFSEKCLSYTGNVDTFFAKNKELEKFFKQKISLTLGEITGLVCKTVEQSKCDLWFEARKLRITGSKNVHDIKTRVRTSINKLVIEIIDPKKVDVKSTQYGLASEERAKSKYVKLYNEQLVDVGVLVCHWQPWLCVSIDAVVVKDGKITRLLEIKSPSSCKNKPVIDISNQESNVKYLEVKNGKVSLIESHFYFTQCQIMLYVTGMTTCDLFVFSPVENGSCRIVVERDEKFLKDVVILIEDFYFRHVLPELYLRNLQNNKP